MHKKSFPKNQGSHSSSLTRQAISLPSSVGAKSKPSDTVSPSSTEIPVVRHSNSGTNYRPSTPHGHLEPIVYNINNMGSKTSDMYYSSPEPVTTPTPFRALINQLRQTCNLPLKTAPHTPASSDLLTKSYLALRNHVSPTLLKSTLPLVSKVLRMDSPPESPLYNITIHDTSTISMSNSADSRDVPTDIIVIDNTTGSSQTVVPFLVQAS